MNDVREKLEALKTAWESFKTSAQQATEEERRLFERLIKEMDAAEINVKRESARAIYE